MTDLEGLRRTLRRLKRKPYVQDRRNKIAAVVERLKTFETGEKPDV
jgi:hypothetical protein